MASITRGIVIIGDVQSIAPEGRVAREHGGPAVIKFTDSAGAVFILMAHDIERMNAVIQKEKEKR